MPLDDRTFATELHHLAERFGRKRPSDEMARRYFHAVRHLTDEAFLAAAQVIYTNDTFWPAPARFLELAGDDPAAHASDAWARVEQMVRRANTSTTALAELYSEHPHAQAAIRDVGGLQAIARCDETRDLPHLARRFQTAYRAEVELARTGQRRAELDQPNRQAITWTSEEAE